MMKRILLVFLSVCLLQHAGAAVTPGNELSKLLSSLIQQEEIHPDSVYPAIERLELRRASLQQPVERAVYSAALGRLYALRYMQAHYAGYRDYYQLSGLCFAEALADLDLLASQNTRKWTPVVEEGKDAKYYNNDLLHVIWKAWNDSYCIRPDSASLPYYRDVIACYERRGNRNAALLVTMDSLSQRNNVSVGELERLATVYADASLCPLVYQQLGSHQGLTATQQRDWLKRGIERYPKSECKKALQNALAELSNPTFSWNGPTSVYPGQTYEWQVTGRNIQSFTLDGKAYRMPEADPVKSVTYTMPWTAPLKPGKYTYTFLPQTKAKLQERITPQKQEIWVSALQLLFRAESDNRAVLMVVDALTGRPRSGVTLSFYRRNEEKTPYLSRTTDADGRVTIKLDGGRNSVYQCVRMSTAEEKELPIQRFYIYGGDGWHAASDTICQMHLYTDRAIYRPGQEVKVAGMVINQHGWDACVQENGDYSLALYDSRGKEVERVSAELDEYGMLSASFTLPTDRNNGTWSVRVRGEASCYFRVEEYKRPTFTVELCDTATFKDSYAVVTGTARTVEGLPLRNARITGTYRYQYVWWLKNNYAQHSIDTLYTDRNGKFSVIIPRDEQYALTFEVDVLSSYGELQHARRWYRVGEMRQYPREETDSSFILRCDCDTFAVDRPARMTLTTKYRDIYLYYVLSSDHEVITDSLIRWDGAPMTIEVPYSERLGTGVTASFCFVKNEKVFSQQCGLSLAHPDRQLRVHWDTFRDLTQPGSTEQWRMTLRNPDGTPARASLLLSLYDSSLDYFVRHGISWDASFEHSYGNAAYYSLRRPEAFSTIDKFYAQPLLKTRALQFSHFNEKYFHPLRSREEVFYAVGTNAKPMMMRDVAVTSKELVAKKSNSSVMRLEGTIAGLGATADAVTEESAEAAEEEPMQIAVPLRQNFQETALFVPSLLTNEQGEACLSFTLPDCITTWNLTGFAHTKDMMSANLSKQIVARKHLQAQLRLPRFLRPGDEAELTATITNTTPDAIAGKAILQLLDARTEKVLLQKRLKFSVAGLCDTTFHFPYQAGEHDVLVKWVAESVDSNDGEQRLLPVLPLKEQFTDTKAIVIETAGVTNYDVSSLFPSKSSDRQLVVEYVAHPEHYAAATLPSLVRAQNKNVLSLMAAYYAGKLAQSLKVDVADSTSIYLDRIQKLQLTDGSFEWYAGLGGSAYLTREVGYLLTRLQMLIGDCGAREMQQRAARYLLKEIPVPEYPSTYLLRNLYVIDGAGLTYSKAEKHKLDSLVSLLHKIDPQELDFEGQALAAIVLQQRGESKRAQRFVEAYRRLLVTSSRGTYIEHPQGPFTSINRKLDIHVQMMEALQQVQPNDPLLSGMRRHLLFEKRTQEWDTPVSSANAIFALQHAGASASQSAQHNDLVTVYQQKKVLRNLVPAKDSLGYVCDTLDVQPKGQHSIRIHKQSAGESWASVLANYSLPYTDAQRSAEGLTITARYPQQVKVGNRLSVEYELIADRDYEFVTITLPRPATAEPVENRSGCSWSDGLLYFREVHDSNTELHLCRVPRGHYVIREEMYVERAGLYHTGVPTVRCEYAREFGGHDKDTVLNID